MKILNLFFKITFPILLIIIIMSFSLENMVVKSISKDIISKKVSSYFLDNIIYDFDSDQLVEMANKTKTSKYIEKITSKYIDILIENLINKENQKLDITNEVRQIVETELNDWIPEEKKREICENIQEQSSTLEEKFENLPAMMDTIDFLLFVKIYGIAINPIFRVIIIVLLIINTFTLIILEKEKSIKVFEIGTMITTIISIIAFTLIKVFSAFIEQDFSGGWIDNINTNLLIAFIVIELIVTVGLHIVNYNINEKNKLKQVENI